MVFFINKINNTKNKIIAILSKITSLSASEEAMGGTVEPHLHLDSFDSVKFLELSH